MIDKIIVLGANGMLGGYITKFFSNLTSTHTYKVISLTRHDFNVIDDNIYKLENIMKEHMNEKTLVINCIGKIPQRNREQDPYVAKRDYYLVNTLFPINLWNLCRKYNSKMIQPTTDCVYSGKKGSYNEQDAPDEFGDYGMSKSLGDNLECTVIRTSIIGKEKYNKLSLLEWLISFAGKEINGYDHHLWNGITCLEYCKLIHYIIQNNLFWSGCRHIYSPEPKSKYELSVLINKEFNLNCIINKITSDIKVDKTLSSIYPKLYTINSLETQIKELSCFDI